MTDIDKRIREALKDMPSETLDEYSADQSMERLAMDVFKGRNKWMVWMILPVALAMTGLMFYAGYTAWHAHNLTHHLMWAALAAVLLLGIGFIKLWFFMEMNKNAIVREIKRVELQIADLSNKIDSLQR